MSTTPEKMEFQTEVRDLLNLMIHSLYSHKEIFLRELVSNAADALDKVRFLSIANPELLGSDSDLKIELKANEETKVLTIEDNGIGMNREDLVANLGTIARSGTKNFLKQMTGESKHDLNLIGQFGVGFYSVFMVASKVEVHTRKAGEEQGYLWTSEGTGEFTLAEMPKASRGTKLTIYIKDEEDCADYCREWQIRSIVRKYSEFVTHPIILLPSDKKDKDDKEEKKAERLNEKPALWRQSPKGVEDEHYKDFFSHVSHEGSEALCWSHNHVEGAQEFWSLLYVPSKAPFGIWQNERSHGLKLYVKRVYIMDDCKELLPTWLRFVRGVIDSEDLPLNVSREILQNNKIITSIRKHVVKKVLDSLQQVATDRPDDYRAFWKELGAVLKEGFYMNWDNLDELKSLLRFHSTKTEGEAIVGLKEYVERMPEGQKEIYYLPGESRAAIQNSPHLEVFKSKGFEVLFMTDTIDEWMMQSLTEYEGKKFHDITRGDVELEKTKEEEKSEKEHKKRFGKLCDSLKGLLESSVSEVRVSSRLKDSPCCLVSAADAMGSHMERLMEMTGQGNFQKSKRILEINPSHPICESLLRKAEAGEDLGVWPTALYGQALLAEGSPLPDPGAYVQAVNSLLAVK